VLNMHTATSTKRSGVWDKWVVVLKRGAKNAVLKRVCSEQEASLLEEQSSTGQGGRGLRDDVRNIGKNKLCQLLGNPDEGGFAFVSVRAPERVLKLLIKLMKLRGMGVKYVEPDTKVRAVPEIKSASLGSWGLGRVGVDSSSRKGRGVNVYVLDTGVRSSHQDFGGRAASAIDLGSGSVVECNGDANCARDGQGHGTHCAGTVGGNTFGVAPEANLFAGKVLSDAGTGSWSWSYAALDWCATTAARPAVASMSLGGPGQQPGMKDAVDAAVDAGVVVVVAGGNENSDSCGFSPAFIPKAITVGSTTSTDKRSSFSNYGSCTDIWAPGSDITSARHTSDTGSVSFSGTSMACPHVSGASALTLADSPDLSSDEVLQALLDRAITSTISGLFTSDTNALLWVGDEAAPPSPPAPPPAQKVNCPSFAASSEPDRDGDCKCRSSYCFAGGASSPNCPCSGGAGAFGGRYFYPNCTDCACK